MVHDFRYDAQTAVVETTRGKVRGYQWDDLFIFKGIPYAKAKRFHAPEPVEAWEGVFDATSFGYVCPLLQQDKPGGELMVPHRFWPMNEDCQNLNIWTPGCDEEKRPVMVWLHGGGYTAGSSIEHLAYEGENMSHYGQVVTVSINHRLNILGYCDLSAFGEEYANSANAGMDDIIAALQWVRDNIQRFGGDPDNVTVFGQSGGGAKVTTLLQMPAADGLFAKGINMSGVIGPMLADCTGSGEDLVRSMMEELSITEVKALETVPYEALAAAYRKVEPALRAANKYVGCAPMPNEFYVGDPLVRGFRKETAQIPLLVGSVFGEFMSFTPADYDRSTITEAESRQRIEQVLGKEASDQLCALFQEAYPERPLIDLMRLDFIFRLPEQQYIRLRGALNNRTYAYLFNQDLPVDGGRTPWHCIDVPYVFHNTEMVPPTQEAGVTERLEQQIFDSVMAFARTGDPNCEAIPEWPHSTPTEEHTMIFDKATRLRTNYDARLIPLVAQHMGPAFARMMQQDADKIQH